MPRHCGGRRKRYNRPEKQSAEQCQLSSNNERLGDGDGKGSKEDLGKAARKCNSGEAPCGSGRCNGHGEKTEPSRFAHNGTMQRKLSSLVYCKPIEWPSPNPLFCMCLCGSLCWPPLPRHRRTLIRSNQHPSSKELEHGCTGLWQVAWIQLFRVLPGP